MVLQDSQWLKTSCMFGNIRIKIAKIDEKSSFWLAAPSKGTCGFRFAKIVKAGDGLGGNGLLYALIARSEQNQVHVDDRK